MIFPNTPISSLILESICCTGIKNAKSIYNDVNTVLPKKVSFQTIYNHLNNLIDTNILIKIGDTYSISLIWLSKIQNITKTTHNIINNINHPIIQSVKKTKKTIKINFNNHIQFNNLMTNLILKFILHKNKKVTMNTDHLFCIDKNFVKKIENTSKDIAIYYIIRNTSDWDKYICLRSPRITKNTIHKCIQPRNKNKNYIIFGNYIMELSLSELDQHNHNRFADILYENLDDYHNTYNKYVNQFTKDINVAIRYDPKKAKILHKRFRDLN